MSRDELIGFINESRKEYTRSYVPEQEKGMRFRDDNRIIRKIRMGYYEELYKQEVDFWRLPKVECVPEKWIRENITKILDTICHEDWHFGNNK